MIEKPRIVRNSSVILLNICVKTFIDFALNPILIAEFQYITSVTITTIIYLIIGIASVKIYDIHRVDYVWIESLKRAQFHYALGKIKNGNIISKFILKRGWFNRLLIGLIFALKNPGLAVIYLRKGSYKYNGFTEKNIKIHFVLYLLFTNILWNKIVVLLINPLFKIIGHLLKEAWFFFLKLLELYISINF